MVLENSDIALFSILGVLLAAILNHRLTLKRDNISKLRQASINLRKVFTTELSDVYPVAFNFPERIDPYLRNKFSTLQAAIAEFRLYLPDTELESFDQTWFEYYCDTQRDIDKGCQSYLHYKNCSVSNETGYFDEQDGHANLVLNIDKILAYAKKYDGL